MSQKCEKKTIRLVETTYAGHYWTCGMCRTLFVLLFCRKLFLRPASLFLVMIITVFTYDVVMLITMLFLWLCIVVYVRYLFMYFIDYSMCLQFVYMFLT